MGSCSHLNITLFEQAKIRCNGFLGKNSFYNKRLELEMFSERERDFKARPEHWVTILNFLEKHPQLIQNKLGYGDAGDSGDSTNSKELWKTLVTTLNSMGFGERSVIKWQMALCRWKSKVRGKVTAIRRNQVKAGGGSANAVKLNNIETRLMRLIASGDHARKLNSSKVPFETPRTSKTVEKPQSVSSQIAYPPLAFFANQSGDPKSNVISSPSSVEKKRKLLQPATKTRIRQSGDKTPKYATLLQMHREQLTVMRQINGGLQKLNETFSNLNNNFSVYLKLQLKKQGNEDLS